jgi:GT2 family glycosyltransferase
MEKRWNELRSSSVSISPRDFVTGNGSVRRNHALAVGCFDQTFTRGEDVEFAMRLVSSGLRMHFAPQAAVWHEFFHTFEDWPVAYYKYGRYDVALVRDHGYTDYLGVVLNRWRGLNPLTRVAARWCVGHPERLRVLLRILQLTITYRDHRALVRPQMALCGGLANIEYWQGFADESGLGADVWRILHDSSILGAPAVDPREATPKLVVPRPY